MQYCQHSVQFLISDFGIGIVFFFWRDLVLFTSSPATPGCGIRISEPFIGDSGSEH
jgi:hypothetical protein